jgi:hypothetical protein
MKICLSLVHLTTVTLLLLRIASAQADVPQARIVSLNVDSQQVVVLHLRPGYVSSVRVLEEVSSVVLGDPGAFKADHSEAAAGVFQSNQRKTCAKQRADYHQRRP